MRLATLIIGLFLLPACHSERIGTDGSDTAKRLHDDVAWLADDAREGRRAGTEQGLVAGRWIADRMSAIGLEPAGDANSYAQEFRVPLEPSTGGGSWIELGGSGRLMENAHHLAPLFASERGEARGKFVYCGYGIELGDRGWNDFAGQELGGRIAVLVRGSPIEAATSKTEAASPHGDAAKDAHSTAAKDAHSTAARDPHETVTPESNGTATPANPHGDVQLVAAGDPFVNAGLVFTKVMNAKRKGASAVVLIQHPSDAGRPVLGFHEGGSGRAGIPCITLAWTDAQSIFGPQLGEWTRDLESRPVRARENDERELALFADVQRGHGDATNVLGVVPGVDRSRTVVLGAHYDHLGFGGTGSLAPNERKIHNGADDNASGTAAVLEVARELRAGPQPACDVLIALWSGEELGLLGSEWWAEHPTLPFERVVGNVNLDMVGRAGNGKLQVLGAGSAAVFSGWLEESGPDADLDLTVNASASAMAGSSDHATFAKRKKPVLHLFSGLHTDYHKPTDDTERFEADGAAHVVTLALDLVRRMASASDLAFVEPPPAPEGERKIQSGFNAWFGSIPNYAFEGPGVKIDGTSTGSPAERAGFLAGDTILAVGEVKIANVYDLTYALQHYKPGDVVLVAFQRDGKRDETRVTLSSRGLR